MDLQLFSERSIWTMLHGIVLGGATLLGLFAAVYALATTRAEVSDGDVLERQGRYLAWLLMFVAAMSWLTVIVGIYVSFPPYRATPPEGVTDLAAYPRALLFSNDNTRWLHAFGMEIKEHMPWIAAMLATSVAFIAARDKRRLFVDAPTRNIAISMLTISFCIVAFAALLGTWINKVAPLE